MVLSKCGSNAHPDVLVQLHQIDVDLACDSAGRRLRHEDVRNSSKGGGGSLGTKAVMDARGIDAVNPDVETQGERRF